MGILKEPAAFIASLKLPKGFSVCDLGDQWMSDLTAPQIASDWYRSIGCSRYESIDGNGRGTVTADLNLPLPLAVHTHGGFDLVTDFGTGEHVFDQAQVWRTMHGLVKPGGYIAFDRPAQGYQKHCYYLTNECVFRDIARANRYEVVWIDRATRKRGELIRGVFRTQKGVSTTFCNPQQGKYLPDLVIR